MDFFNSTVVEDDKKADYLGLDNAGTGISIALTLLESKYEPHITCGLKTISGIYNCFFEVSPSSLPLHLPQRIISLKTTQAPRGVDLAREERLEKCDKIITSLESVVVSKGMERAERFNSDLTVKLK